MTDIHWTERRIPILTGEGVQIVGRLGDVTIISEVAMGLSLDEWEAAKAEAYARLERGLVAAQVQEAQPSGPRSKIPATSRRWPRA